MTATLFIGGARSGKSGAAATLAELHGGSVAVAVFGRRGLDGEFDRRIESHALDRSAEWRTIEAADSSDWIGEIGQASVVVVDCVGTWLSALAEVDGYDVAEASVLRTCGELLALSDVEVIFVSNEVGSSLTPLSELGRAFTDALGRINQHLAKAVDRTYLCVAGITISLNELAVTPNWRNVE